MPEVATIGSLLEKQTIIGTKPIGNVWKANSTTILDIPKLPVLSMSLRRSNVVINLVDQL